MFMDLLFDGTPKHVSIKYKIIKLASITTLLNKFRKFHILLLTTSQSFFNCTYSIY